MADPTMTDDEYAALRQQLAAETMRRATAAAAERTAKLKPLTDLIASDAWAAFRAQIGGAATAAIGEVYYDQVRALDVISGNLGNQIPAATAPLPSA